MPYWGFSLYVLLILLLKLEYFIKGKPANIETAEMWVLTEDWKNINPYNMLPFQDYQIVLVFFPHDLPIII